MKKILFNIFAFVVVLSGLVSCSSSDSAPADTVKIHFTATIDDEALRSSTQDLYANTLIVGIYDAQQNEIKREGFAVTSTTISASIDLVAGQTYNLIFWAQNCDCSIYDIDDLKAIKMDAFTSSITVEQAKQSDAFCGVKTSYVADGNSSLPVKLTRPLAQVNLGTTGTAQKTTLTLNQVYNTYHPFSGSVSGSADITWDFSELFSESFIVNGVTYNYLAMGYLFAPATPASFSGTMTINNGSTTTTTNIPDITLQENYKTNIGGNFTN